MITDFNFKLKFTPTEMLENRFWETIELMRSALIPRGIVGCTDEFPAGVGHIGRALQGNQFIISGRGTSVLEELDWALYSRCYTELRDDFLIADGLIAPPWEAFLISGLLLNKSVKAKAFVITRCGRLIPDMMVCKYNDTLVGCREVLTGTTLPREGIIGIEGVPGLIIAYGGLIDSVCINLSNKIK